MPLPLIVTVADLDPATLTVVSDKVVARDPTKAPNSITAAPASATVIATGDTVDLALNKLQAQVTAAGGGLVYKATFGGPGPQYTITHNLGTLDVSVTVIDLSTGANAGPGIVRLSPTQVRLDFVANIAANSHRVIVQAI